MNIPRKITYKLVIRTFYDAVKGAVLQYNLGENKRGFQQSRPFCRAWRCDCGIAKESRNVPGRSCRKSKHQPFHAECDLGGQYNPSILFGYSVSNCRCT